MKKNRIMSEEESLARTAFCIKIKNQCSLDGVPRIFDYQANGEMWIDHAMPKQDRIRLVVNSCTDLKNGKKIIKDAVEQANIDITFKNAERLKEALEKVLKRYKNLKSLRR